MAQLDVRATNGDLSARERGSRTPAAPARGPSSDAALISRVGRGDRRALRTLYGRYAREIFDFAASVCGAANAPAVVEETFATAWDRLRVGIRPARVEAWLLGIARGSALSRTSSRSASLAFSGGATDERGELVRRWAETLTPREYALIDLYLRRGLSIRELAGITGNAEQSVRDAIDRAAADAETFVASELVLRRAGSCYELPTLLDRLRGAGAEDRRKAVRVHARLCDRCAVTAQQAGAPLAVLADLSSAPLSPEASAPIWSAIAAHSGGSPAESPPSTKATATRRERPRVIEAIAIAACAAAAVVVLALLNPFGDRSSRQVGVDAGSVTPNVVPPVSVFTPPVAAESKVTNPQRADSGQASSSAASKPTTQGSRPAQKPAQKPSTDPPVAKPRAKAPEQPPAATPATTPLPKAAEQKPSPRPQPSPPPSAAPVGSASPGTRTLAWAPVPGAVGYEFVLVFEGRQVYKARTKVPRATIPKSAPQDGTVERLPAGTYRWVVWPIMPGQGKSSGAIVISNLQLD